jgi:hypothetical protein
MSLCPISTHRPSTISTFTTGRTQREGRPSPSTMIRYGPRSQGSAAPSSVASAQGRKVFALTRITGET